MRCLQANLAYLAAIADRVRKPTTQVPLAPAIMMAPKYMPGLMDSYRQLLSMFPDVHVSSDGTVVVAGAIKGGGGIFGGHAGASTITTANSAGSVGNGNGFSGSSYVGAGTGVSVQPVLVSTYAAGSIGPTPPLVSYQDHPQHHQQQQLQLQLQQEQQQYHHHHS